MSTPEEYPRQPTGRAVDITWAESPGQAIEPTPAKKLAGWNAGDVVDKGTRNWADQAPMRAARSVFSQHPTAEKLFTTWLARHGIWSNDAMPPLQGFLSDGPAGVNTLVCDLWADPNGTGAVRVQVNVPKATPTTFVATRDTFVFSPIDSLEPPTIAGTELSYIDVPVGDPQPATPAGTVPVWRVRTDAATITEQEILVPTIPVLHPIALLALTIGGDLEVNGATTLNGTLDVCGSTQLGDDLADTVDVFGNTTLGDDETTTVTIPGAVTITALGSLDVDGTFTADTGNLTATASVKFVSKGETILGTSAADLLTVEAATTFKAPVSLQTSLTVLGASGGSISSDPTAELTWLGNMSCAGRMNIGTVGTVEGDIYKSGGLLRYRDASGARYVPLTTAGVRRGYGQATTVGPSATATLSTATAVAPIVAATMDITARVWIKRAIAGDVTISLIEVGVGQIGTSGTISVPAVAGSDWRTVTFSRSLAAGTTPRIYQLSVNGGGSAVTLANAKITAAVAELLG
jgi:hypothetical protein